MRHNQKIAEGLDLLILIAFICNIVILYLVPVAVISTSNSFPEGLWDYLNSLLFPGKDDIVLAGIAASFIAWAWFWQDAHDLVLTLFLLVCGSCTAVILWQGRQVLRTVLRGTPFSLENALSLHRAALCAFLISAAALIRVGVNVFLYRSLLPLASYNTLFVPFFAMFGLLCLVMSALFRQAAELKAESDLTI